jgi:outer membrane protein assembly factor BamA
MTQWVADTYGPHYNLGYKKISGTLLTGLEVEELTFKGDKLLDSLKVSWNPISLLYNRVSLSYLDANGLNVKNIKTAVESFIPKKAEIYAFPFSIGVSESHMTFKPFDEIGIGFKEISLNGKSFIYYGEGINIEDFSLFIDSDVFRIKLDAGVKDKKMRVKNLSILDLDTIAFQDLIKKMIDYNIYDEIEEKVDPEIKKYRAGKENLLPESVLVDSAIITFKPTDYPQIRMNHGEMNVSSVKVDIHRIIDFESNAVQVGNLSMIVDTNLSHLTLDSKLEDETIKIESLSLRNIDTMALIKTFGSIKESQMIEGMSIETNSTVNSLMPKALYLKQMDTSFKSARYNSVFLNNAEVNATNFLFNIANLTAQSGEINVSIVSNIASFEQYGVIKGNQIRSRGDIIAHKALFETYGLPIKQVTFNSVNMDIQGDENQLVVDFDVKGDDISQGEKDLFNFEHLSLKNRITYMIPERKLRVENEGNVSTPYVKEVHFENILTLKDDLKSYKGKVIPGKFEKMDADYTKFLNNLEIDYIGDADSIEVKIGSEGLKGKFTSYDFKKGELTLSVKEDFTLENMFLLPKKLHPSRVALDVYIPLNFSNLIPMNASAKFASNLVDMDIDLLYDTEYKITIKTSVPEDSLLKEFNSKLNFDAISPIYTDLTTKGKIVHANIQSKEMNSRVKFNLENKNLDGYTNLGGTKFEYKGNIEKKLYLDHYTSSVKNFLKQISTIYTFEVPSLNGDAKTSIVFSDMKDVELKFNADILTYKPNMKTDLTLNNTMISLDYANSILSLNKYYSTFQDQKIFANKPSLITFKDGVIDISSLWINDELKVTGGYNIENKKGEMLAVADTFNVSHEKGDLASRIDIKTGFEEGKTAVEGTVTILGGEIHHDMEVKTFSPDSDIVNVDELKKKENSPMMENLSSSIKVNTEKPLIYKKEKADVKANADLLIHKSHKEPVRVLGTVEILNGSTYRLHNKRFVFKNSSIDFAGDPYKPILDLTAMYKTTQSEIIIHITGSIANPNVIFSSIPHMSRKEILSTILFDVPDNNQNISEENMILMMGDSMAQSVFSNIGGEIIKYVFSTVGINIDKLPFIGRSRDLNQSKEAFFSLEDKDEIPSHNIHFTGQKNITEKDLQKAMGVDTKNIFQFWKKDKPTIKDQLLPTLERSLQNFYDSEGFYNADFLIKTSKNDVIVSIDENKPVTIEDINISSDYDISDIVTFKKGQIFRSKEFVSAKNKIIGNLMKEGYCSYDLDSKAYVDLDSYKVKIHFKLKKGDICTFGKLTIKGLETIDDSVVISRVRAKEGKPFSTDRIEETYDALYDLNSFDYISVKYDRKFYNVVPIEITGMEVVRPWYFMSDVDYTSSDGFRISAGVKRTNLMGNAKNISLNFTYSRIDKGVEMSYFVPALFKVSDYYIDLKSKIGYSEFKYEGFTEKKGYGEALLSYNNSKWNIDTGLAIENIDILSANYRLLPSVKAGKFLPVYPFFRLTYDNRDPKVNPKYGYFLGGMVEYGLPYDDEKESSYFKYSLEGRALYSFRDLTLSAIAKAGIVDHNENEIPESKFFFAGGFDTNRAYGYRDIGVITSPTSYTIEGASTMANLSLEANYPIVKNLYAEIFNDNTMLTKDVYDFSGDIISSAGVGIGYRTSLGQIKFNIGMNVQDTSQYEVNLYIGQRF